MPTDWYKDGAPVQQTATPGGADADTEALIASSTLRDSCPL